MHYNSYGQAPIPSNKLNTDIYGNPVNQQFSSMGQKQPYGIQQQKPPMNQPPMHQPAMHQQKFLEFANQIEEIKQKFSSSFQECPLITEQNQTKKVYQVIISANNLNYPLKIILDENFPNSAPIIKPVSKIQHPIINPQTFTIDYENEIRWIPMQSKIVFILDYVIRNFNQFQPKLDPLMEQYNKLMNECNFDQLLDQFSKVDFLQIYQTENYQTLAPHVSDNSEQLQQSLASTTEFKNLSKKFLQLLEFNNETQDKTNKLLEDYSKKCDKLNLMNQKFEEKKQLFLQKYNQYQMVIQRFNKEKILQVLEEQLMRLDEQSAQEMEIRNSNYQFMNQESQMIDQREQMKKVQKQLQDFYEYRKLYHLQTIKKEKLVEQM